MANVPETAAYDAGVYQIETTDPVLGGANGIANVQAKQLANRTKYLKARADLVDEAAGSALSLVERLAAIETDVAGTSPDMTNALVAMVMEAEAKGGLALREIQKTLKQRIQTGQATIRNTGVISGCIVTATGTSRSVDMAAGVAYYNGLIVPVYGQLNTASVPQNTGGTDSFCELYLDATGDCKATALGAASPSGTLILYRITIPAGNIAENLTGCTFTFTATSQPSYPAMLTALPKASIVLPYNMDGAGYLVDLEIVSFSGASQQIGRLNPANKTTSGFDIQLNGTADSVVVNWTARKLDL